MKQAYELGYHKAAFPEEVGGLGFTPLQTHILQEEFMWGSVGLTAVVFLGGWPYFKLLATMNLELIQEFVLPFFQCTDGKIGGCWAITEPEHGSDALAVGEPFFSDPKIKGQVRARLEGDEWVLNGQKAAWVSGGTIATHGLLHCQIDPSRGFAGNGICIVPLNLEGVSKGKPLEKIGQRDLNQGEIFFNDVRIPKSWMMCEPDFYIPFVDMILASTNLCMAGWSTGLARAAFEESFNYAN